MLVPRNAASGCNSKSLCCRRTGPAALRTEGHAPRSNAVQLCNIGNTAGTDQIERHESLRDDSARAPRAPSGRVSDAIALPYLSQRALAAVQDPRPDTTTQRAATQRQPSTTASHAAQAITRSEQSAATCTASTQTDMTAQPLPADWQHDPEVTKWLAHNLQAAQAACQLEHARAQKRLQSSLAQSQQAQRDAEIHAAMSSRELEVALQHMKEELHRQQGLTAAAEAAQRRSDATCADAQTKLQQAESAVKHAEDRAKRESEHERQQLLHERDHAVSSAARAQSNVANLERECAAMRADQQQRVSEARAKQGQVAAGSQASTERINDLEGECERLTSAHQQLHMHAAALTADLAKSQQARSATEQSLAAVRTQIDALQQRVDNLTADKARLLTDKEDLLCQIAHAQAAARPRSSVAAGQSVGTQTEGMIGLAASDYSKVSTSGAAGAFEQSTQTSTEHAGQSKSECTAGAACCSSLERGIAPADFAADCCKETQAPQKVQSPFHVQPCCVASPFQVQPCCVVQPQDAEHNIPPTTLASASGEGAMTVYDSKSLSQVQCNVC